MFLGQLRHDNELAQLVHVLLEKLQLHMGVSEKTFPFQYRVSPEIRWIKLADILVEFHQPHKGNTPHWGCLGTTTTTDKWQVHYGHFSQQTSKSAAQIIKATECISLVPTGNNRCRPNRWLWHQDHCGLSPVTVLSW
jgi:hypothetical protein